MRPPPLTATIVLCFAACSAKSRDDALERVKAGVLAPNGWSEADVVVYAAAEILPAGTRIAPVLARDGTAPVVRTLERDTWFFFIDALPFARYHHPTAFVYVDAQSLELETSLEEWYPTVNGEDVMRAPERQVLGAPVYRNVAPLRLAAGDAGGGGGGGGAPGAGGHPAYPCCRGFQAIVVNGEPGNRNTTSDVASITAALTARGFAVTPIVAANNTVPALRAAEIAMTAALRALAGLNPPLCQVFLFYAGHGSGGTMVFGPNENGPIQTAPSDLFATMDAINACETAIMMDACDSGQALQDWRVYNMQPKGSTKNVAVYAACGPVAKAYTDLTGGGSYTNAEVAHLGTLPAGPLPLMTPATCALPAGTTLGTVWTQTPISAAYPGSVPCCPGTADGGTGVMLGDGGVGPDGGPRDGGQVAMAPPVVSPIGAVFDQATFSTTYTLLASDPDLPRIRPGDLDIRWSGTNCGEAQPSVPEVAGTEAALRAQLYWSHPHPPCDPTTSHADVTITASISDGTHTVVCRYHGAETGTGEPCVSL